MINILQIGMGYLGRTIAEYINEKQSMRTVAAIDINPDFNGVNFSDLSSKKINHDFTIGNAFSNISNLEQADVVVLTTSSSLETIYTQLDEILDYSLPVVSTCEELTFPWKRNQSISTKIDVKAKKKGVAVVSTGVNPGFLMDTLPTMLTGVCKNVSHVQVSRIQDARTRRIPFQKKIGAGLTLDQFEERKQEGSLRHVGLTESMYFVAQRLGWEIDFTEDVISPVIAHSDIVTDQMEIPKGYVMGVQQIGRALNNGEEKIKLNFQAAVGNGESYDEIQILGEPNINSKIEGGVHGDIATCSIVLNTIPRLLQTTPGLKTMSDLPVVSFIH